MLKTITHLKGFSIRGLDGDLGTVEQLYFDQQSWTVRYLTVDTGRWLENRRVLISPFSIQRVNWQARRIEVSILKEQLEKSPEIDVQQPISRQHEISHLGYFGYPHYWADGAQETKGSHLRSAGAISGYDIQATDGEIGHVSGLVLDDETWAIRYIEVSTRNWWPNHKVVIAPAWIQRVNWMSSKVYLELSRAAIQSAPEYLDSMEMNREYEIRLYSHYKRPTYWQGAEIAQALLLSEA